MTQRTGKCPGCDSQGKLGAACPGKACTKRHHHFIPLADWERAHGAAGEPGPDPLIGQVVGDFLIVDFVGQGGFGKVYLGLQTPLYRLKGAVKLLELPSTNVMLTRALSEKFQQEAEALAELTHPNIVGLLKYGLHAERPYLVMEFVDRGATLRDELYARELRKLPFTRRQIVHVLDQLLHGLESAHDQQIIHRDIKPENVMLQAIAGNPFHVKILDFGTAKFVENRADTKWPLGSPSYMAPEQVALKNLGPWTDLYAVGVMAFELFTGRRPHYGEDESEIVARKLDPEFDVFAALSGLELPEAFRAFVNRALAMDPTQRYQTAGEFRAGLRAAAEAWPEGQSALSCEVQELTSQLSGDDLELISTGTANASSDALAVDQDAATRMHHPDPPAAPPGRTDEPTPPPARRARWPWLVAGLLLLGASAVGMLGVDALKLSAAPPATSAPPPADAPTPLPLPALRAAGDGVASADEAASVAAAEESARRGAPAMVAVLAALDSATVAAAQPVFDVLQVSAGKFHTCALLRHEGQVRCWGANFEGSLGLGNDQRIGDDEAARASQFVSIGGEATRVVAAGDRQASFTCALLDGGAVRCWGANKRGQLGYGHTRTIGDDESPSSAAGDVQLSGPAAALTAGASEYGSHACALLDDGRVQCWGANKFGQLGYGHTRDVGDDETPASAGVVDLGDAPAREVAAGKFHTCALLEGGQVRCWGWNEQGQLGLGHTESVGDDEVVSSVDPVDLGAPVAQITLGRRHSCALLDGGRVRCWGWNNAGQLGLGHTDDIGDDEAPSSVDDVEVGGSVRQISAGGLHTCALLDDGAVRCWGDNKFGQLGYSHTRDVGDDEAPASAGDVALGGPARAVAAGSYHTCALMMDDTLRCWGYNKFGQLGYGHTRDIGDDEIPAGAGPVPFR